MFESMIKEFEDEIAKLEALQVGFSGKKTAVDHVVFHKGNFLFNAVQVVPCPADASLYSKEDAQKVARKLEGWPEGVKAMHIVEAARWRIDRVKGQMEWLKGADIEPGLRGKEKPEVTEEEKAELSALGKLRLATIKEHAPEEKKALESRFRYLKKRVGEDHAL